jgi:hypothetical protein
MRGYTPWRVEEVGRLHRDERVRLMKDSKVRIGDTYPRSAQSLTDRNY